MTGSRTNGDGGGAIAYLGLGANLGDRRAAIESAVTALENRGVRVAARSPLYETDAVTPDWQPPYLNAAVRVATTAPARELLMLCLEIESALGRVRPPGQRHAPRTMDIDLLLYSDAVIEEGPTLVVPHPRLLERGFARIPLADVAQPGLVHPRTGERLDVSAADPSVRRV